MKNRLSLKIKIKILFTKITLILKFKLQTRNIKKNFYFSIMSNKLQEIKKLLKKENMLEKQKKKFNDGHNKNNSDMKSLYLRFLIL